jgi:hypothetical protein
MFVRTKDEEKIPRNVEIQLGTLVGLEKDEDAFIILGLLNYGDAMGIRDAFEHGSSEVAEYMRLKLPAYVKSHNFYETEKELMTNDAVIQYLYSNTPAFLKITEAYLDKVFFTTNGKHKA